MSGSTPRRKAKRRLRRPGVADTVQGPSSGPTAPREEATPNVDLHAQAAQENLDRDFRAAVTGGLAAAVAMVARNAEDFGIVPDKERFKTILDNAWEANWTAIAVALSVTTPIFQSIEPTSPSFACTVIAPCLSASWGGKGGGRARKRWVVKE